MVIRAVAGGPDDGANVLCSEIDLQCGFGGDAGRLESVWRLFELGLARVGPDVEPIEEPVHLEVRKPTGVGEPTGELSDTILHPAQTPDNLDAESGECVEVDGTMLR